MKSSFAFVDLCKILVVALAISGTACRSNPSGKAAPSTQPAGVQTLREPIKIEVGKVRKPLPYRIVSFHRGKADKRLIKLASELGFNGVQIQIEGSNVDGVKAFAKYDDKEKLIDYCHSLGMSVTLWVRELSDVPREWMPEWLGPVTVDNEAIWSMLDARYEWMLSQAVPKVDGLVLTVVETTIRATDTPVMLKTANLIAEKCRKYNKSFIVRTFVWYVEEFDAVMAAVNQLPADQVIMSKCVPQDWNIRGVNSPEIGKVGERPQIIEFDAAGEYFLKSSVPNCMPDQLKRQFDYGIANNIDGICVRVDRDDDSVLHEPNEVNLWALGMLATGATDDVDEIWDAWATNRFGKSAGPGVVRALKPAHEVVAEMLSVGPLVYCDARTFAQMPDEDFLGHLRQSWRWDKTQAEVHDRAEVGDPAFVAQVTQDKERAERIAKTCLMDLELVKEQLKPEDYQILRTKLLTMKAQMEFRGPMALAALNYRQLINAQTDQARAVADAAMQIHLARVRAVTLPIYPASTELKYLDRTWKVGQPENIPRDNIYSWAWKVDMLREGKNPRPVTPGHGMMPPVRGVTTSPGK